MSQRSTRAAIKRTFSLDNIDINAQSQSVSLENLIAGKPNGDYVVVNSKKRRKQKPTQSQNNQVSTDLCLNLSRNLERALLRLLKLYE